MANLFAPAGEHIDWNLLGDLSTIGKSFQGNTHTTPEKFTPYLPPNKAGAIPENYQPTNEDQIRALLSNPMPGQGLLGLSDTTKQLESSKGLSDDEYTTLEREAAAGNKMAMSLLDEYKPSYGPTGTQFEQQLTDPMVNELKQLPSLYSTLQAQQAALDNQLPSALSQIESTAQQYSGISPQAPNAQTTAMMNQYVNTANNAIAASNPVMTSALKDLGSAAEISVKTFPYTILIEDLLNRYAYQLESPSYTPPPINMPGVSAAIQKLFEASTGTQFGSTNTGLTLPGQATASPINLAQPNLAPASNPSSSG